MSLKLCRFLLIIFTFPGSKLLPAQDVQRFNSFSYSVNEGLLQSNVIDIAFDKNNFCWLSFANGIQRFDGKNFSLIPIQTGLPDDKWVHFFRTGKGDLLISHSRGISKYEVLNNKFTLIYENKLTAASPVTFIGEDGGDIYFYTFAGNITGMDSRSFNITSNTQTKLPDFHGTTSYSFKISDNIIDHRVGIQLNSTLYLWDLQQKKILYEPVSIAHVFNYMLLLKTSSSMLYCNIKDAIMLESYDFVSKKITAVAIRQRDDKRALRSNIFFWQNKTLLNFSNHLYEVDPSLAIRSELVNFQNKPIAGNAVIAKLKKDNFGNLYLVTINDGIRKIIRNNHPIHYYGTEKKEDNYTISILADKENNRVFAGTYGNGLLVFDTLQHLIKHFKTLPGDADAFSPNAIIRHGKNGYLLLAISRKELWHLSNDLQQLSPVKVTVEPSGVNNGPGYFAKVLLRNEKEALLQSQGNLYRINFDKNDLRKYDLPWKAMMSGLLYQNNIILHSNNELIFLDAISLKEQKKIPFKNTGEVRCYVSDLKGNIYIGSNKGIFKIDPSGNVLEYLDKGKGLPDECIYAMTLDKDGALWCSCNKGIFKVATDKSIIHLKKEDGLQENEFNTNTVDIAPDGEIFFGGINGISSFYPAAITPKSEKISIFFTSIKTNNQAAYSDTALYTIDKLTLPYNSSSLSFDFIAMGPNNPEAYVYQYKMQGIDDEWIRISNPQTVHYFLQPGTYTFKVFASEVFDKNAKPLKEILIVIDPPFWKLWWVRLIIGLLFAGILAWLMNLYTHNRYQKKLAELESERKLQQERERISRDLHDNIGAYANAVIYNTELLQKEENSTERNKLMNGLRFASKDIITSLRETIWALKKQEYPAQDCLLRIRNFIQPFTRYYEHIRFTVNGEAPVDLNLHSTNALNLVRIVQEAVSNAIKHTNATEITVTSETDNGKWKILIIDNGKGFDYHTAIGLNEGNGLGNMQQRAADAGFELRITSEEKGTEICVGVV